MTLEEAKSLKSGQIVYHVRNKNKDGTPQRWKVNGKVTTWKTFPERVYVSLKHGLYTHDHLTEDDLHLVTINP